MSESNGAGPATEMSESQKIWQEYLQKCCEVGQLFHTLDQIDAQKREIEKKLEVTQRAVKSTSARHKELQQELLAKKAQQTEPAQPEAH